MAPTITVGTGPGGRDFTPDSTRDYITNGGSNNVSVIITSSITVVDTITVGTTPSGVGIIRDVPFAAFSPSAMIDFGTAPNTDAFVLKSSFTLGSTSNGINPPANR
ncbi:MAG: hypothetical protein ACREDT_10985 [Methylocella sp.]